ncbi:aminopeptidase P family protein [Yonghaparkia sp. Soil809]|uniref:aminopeptidase P family protein n=1 Tax=Yonghaparkia sp. Soil809 TaxID=1736417 RepID=UPI0006F2BA5C|nr:aminopeptidase P family protein [Yonghaparkia sp. Soil809]KRF32767.1 Xaa-Pro aminopeptidase [Yonghaparkia sp. Soil809]
MAETDQKDAPRATANRSTTPGSDAFKEYISQGWAERPSRASGPREQAAFAAERRARVSALHPTARLVIPAGPAKQRSNDTDYPYRAHSAFAHLTGWGSDTVPGSVLILEPRTDEAGEPDGHDAVLYFREAAGRDSDEFYANPEIGEFWTGPRPTASDVALDLGLATRGLGELEAVLESLDARTLVVRDADRAITDRVDALRLLLATDGADDAEALAGELTERDADLARDLSELRLVKDSFEIEEMRRAVAATRQGFDDVIADLPEIVRHPRGERLVEGAFDRRARAEGNTVGYDTIAASGPHACILHWTRNDGPVLPGDLILIDAGVELESYYTADITRTLPVSGTFTDVQRRVYEAVREAADAAFAVVRPGIRFREIHAAAMEVIARRTAEWGLLPVTAEEALQPEGGQHRRYMVHGTSHHLGLDVHDCAQARRDLYLDGILEPGMVFTIEPGLYFQPDDLTVPEEYRGIGVRIEDDVMVTADGCESLSAGIPRTADEVEAWMARAAR